MNSFYYFFYEDLRREDPCVERLNVMKKLQVYDLWFTTIEFLHIYSH